MMAPLPAILAGLISVAIGKFSQWMKCSRVVTATDCQCQSRNCPGFDPSILRRSRSAADEAVLE
jgi:hypothetical protein